VTLERAMSNSEPGALKAKLERAMSNSEPRALKATLERAMSNSSTKRLTLASLVQGSLHPQEETTRSGVHVQH